MLTIIQLPVLNDNYIYLLHDGESGQTAAIDPAVAAPVLAALSQYGWQLSQILITHHHSDHIGGITALKAQTSCMVIAAAADQHRIPDVDRGVMENDVVAIGQHKAQVIATPGHTSGHIVYYFAEDGLLFCGDTLFVMGCGRLFEGTAGQLWASLQKLKGLPSETRIYCSHEYSQSNGRFALTLEPDNQALQEKMRWVDQCRTNGLPTVPSTLAEELASNPFLRVDSPSVQKSCAGEGNPAVKVFAAIRHLKDQFSD